MDTKQIDEMHACLSWALDFAQGSIETDPSLDNEVFNGWLDRCRHALELLAETSDG